MFCPDCGTENLKSQKFCTRCGANLVVIDRAREILSELTTGAPANQLAASTVLKIFALVSIFGFMFVTAAVIVLAIAQYAGPPPHDGPPLSVLIGMFGYGAIVLICRQLLKLISPSTYTAIKQPLPPSSYAPPAMPGAPHRALGEGAAYHSVTEQTTRQFEAERSAKP